MDVEAALALASAAAASAVGGAATAAGQNAWRALVALARRATGRTEADARVGGETAPAEAAGTTADAADEAPADERGARELTARIAERARTDAAFAAQLCQWAETHRAAVEDDRSQVHNTVAGTARVEGPVIQARDIHGGITF